MIERGDAASLLWLRRVRRLATVDQWRLVAGSLFAFLLLDVIRLALVSPVPMPNRGLITTMDVVGYLAIIVALWRPLLGLGIALAPLGTAVFWTSTSLDAVLLTVLTALVITQVEVRQAIAISAGLLGYVGLRGIVYQGEQRVGLVVGLGASLTLGLVIGWVGNAFRRRRNRAARGDLERAMEENRIRVDERRDLTADLHDVVVHHLSTASLHLLGVHDETETGALRRTLGTVERSTSAALTELRLLAEVLRHDPSTAANGMKVRDLSRWQPPTQACAEAQLDLVRAGLEPQVNVPAAADSLAMTVQRTLSRLVKEAVANQVAHAPSGALCTIDVDVAEHQVTLRAANAMPQGSDGEATLGWGLLGLRERVTLTGGDFAVGQDGPDWVLTATLPRE